MSDFYKILGVSEESEKIVIDAAFRALAKKYHPDVWTGSKSVAEKKIREINEAYEVLSNSKRRKEYDLKKILLNRKQKNQNLKMYDRETLLKLIKVCFLKIFHLIRVY